MLRTLLYALVVLGVRCGQLWQEGNVRLQPQCANAGRRLGHGFQGACSMQSNRERSLYFKTRRHRMYGLQSFPAGGIDGKVLLVDCITYQCSSADPTSTGGRRVLGHGGASATTPAGWYPDTPGPLRPRNEPDGPGKGRCDIASMVNATKVQAEPTWAVVTFYWILVCSFVPKTTGPWKQFREIGFVGLVYLAPCAETGCGPSVYTSEVANLFDANPDPKLPVCIASQGNDPVDLAGQKLLESPGEPPDDEVSFQFQMLQAISDNVAGAPGPWATTVYIACTDERAHYYDAANSAASRALYIIYGIGNIVLLLLSMQYLVKQRRDLCRWAVYMALIEGTVGSAFRLFRCFTGQYFWNGAPGRAGTPIDLGNYMSDAAEVPFSLTTTWIAALIWTKIVLGRALTERQAFKFNLFISFGVVSWFCTIQTMVMFFPFQPWTQITPAGVRSSTQLREYGNIPVLYINMGLVGIFSLASLTALIKIACAYNDKTMVIVKKMAPFILIQVVGLVLGIIAQFAILDVASSADSFSLVWAVVVPGHFKEFGGLLAGYGQVGALVIAGRTSSPSSSSSSSSSSSAGKSMLFSTTSEAAQADATTTV